MSPWTHVVGWTLIHFVWQGAVLAVIAAAALRLCRHRSPNARYAIACAVLAVMLASPLISARVLMTADSTVPPAARPPQSISAPEMVSTGPLGQIDDRVFSIHAVWADVDALLPAIVFIWLAGVAVLLIRMAGGLWRVRRLQVGSLAAHPSSWQMATERIAARLGLGVAVHVVESALVDTPMVVGWMRPVILLPLAALANLTPAQVEAILAHELIHIRRHDYVVNMAQTVAETLLFFHPGVWWVSEQIRTEREHCCDDVAVEVCGDPVEYAAALAQLEAWRCGETALALAAVNGSLIGRVRRLLNVPIGHEARSLSWLVTLGLTFLSAVVVGGIYVSSSSFAAGGAVPAVSAQAIDPIASPDTFDWQVHPTTHFDIHYYPALMPNLEQVAESAERAYQRISSELQYNLPFRVPLVLFKTRTDFEQQSIAPELPKEAISRGLVNAFSEHKRNRVVILVEEEPDKLDRLMTHELTHIFAFDIIPRSSANAGRVAAWIDEGFAEYLTGVWDPDRLRHIGDLVMADSVPKVSAGNVDVQSLPAAAHDLGHAVFEFIEAEYGKPAVWQFLIEVRRSVVDGTGDLYQRAFNRTPEEFDSAFEQYLRGRFR